MKRVSSTKGGQADAAASGTTRPAREGKIHPVIMYPFRQPTDYSDLEELYSLVARLDAERDRYARPVTVIDRKTHYAGDGNKAYAAFRKSHVARHSDVIDAWCVDTCQMWCSGLGAACEASVAGDVHWLIPGDFNYGSANGKEVLGRLHELPEFVMELQQDLCVGEIATDHAHSKQLIDDYGTFALLYHWFPVEAQAIRNITERPRSEFFAISHTFLSEILRERWYAYEQTMVMLLKAVFGHRPVGKFFVGGISDLPQGRDSLASAVQQVERTERVLRSLWLERHQAKPDWTERYCQLERESDQVRRTALIVLKNLLK